VEGDEVTDRGEDRNFAAGVSIALFQEYNSGLPPDFDYGELVVHLSEVFIGFNSTTPIIAVDGSSPRKW
jgi:hypothetical protein